MQANYLLTERNGDLGISVAVFEDLQNVASHLHSLFYERACLYRDIPPGSPESGTQWDKDKAAYDAQRAFIRVCMTEGVLEKEDFCFRIDHAGRCWRTDAHAQGADDWSFKVEKASPTWCHPSSGAAS